MLLRAILSAALGTVGMTLSSTTEMKLRGRPESTAPGQAANKILRLVGVPHLEGKAFEVLSTWTHWIYGMAWGVVFWLLIDIADLPLAAAGIAFFFIVWIAEQIQLPLLGVAPPPWRWGIRENVIDAWHHVAYAVTTVVAWVLIGIASYD